MQEENVTVFEEKTNRAYELLERAEYGKLKELLAEMEPADIALLLSEADREKIPFLFRILPKELAADTFVEMDSEEEKILIEAFSDAELKNVMDSLFLDDTVDIIEEMPANVVSRILRYIPPQRRKLINEFMNYPDNSAGSIMTIEYIDIKASMTVNDAMNSIRRTGLNKEAIYTCYVTDGNRRLVGLVTAITLITESPDKLIGDIMDTNVIYAETLDEKEDAAKLIEKYDLLAIPIVDRERRLVGIVTVDDAIDVIQEAAEEDFAKMASMAPMEKPYLRTSVFSVWRSRIVWLLFLMVSATFTGMIITSFETALAAQVTLTAFIPMLMDTGGNSGSQASVTVIRGLSLGEIEFSDIFTVIWKELRVSILCGLSLAAAIFVKILLVDNLILGQQITMLVAAVISITLFLSVIIAKLIGCTLPIFADKLGFDPAVMASPFITTIIDTVSLLVYFNLAKLILKL